MIGFLFIENVRCEIVQRSDNKCDWRYMVLSNNWNWIIKFIMFLSNGCNVIGLYIVNMYMKHKYFVIAFRTFQIVIFFK